MANSIEITIDDGRGRGRGSNRGRGRVGSRRGGRGGNSGVRRSNHGDDYNSVRVHGDSYEFEIDGYGNYYYNNNYTPYERGNRSRGRLNRSRAWKSRVRGGRGHGRGGGSGGRGSGNRIAGNRGGGNRGWGNRGGDNRGGGNHGGGNRGGANQYGGSLGGVYGFDNGDGVTSDWDGSDIGIGTDNGNDTLSMLPRIDEHSTASIQAQNLQLRRRIRELEGQQTTNMMLRVICNTLFSDTTD